MKIERAIIGMPELRSSMYGCYQNFENIVCMVTDIESLLPCLTNREREVLIMIGLFGNQEAAKRLNISLPTIKYYIATARRKIMQKSGAVYESLLYA
jgi:ATP/maltotriose-dependent transcriptional regulator MalT